MSQERVLKALVQLGLSQPDSEVYVFPATIGPQKARNIVTALKMYKRKIYCSLQSFQSKEMVNATLEYPAQFSVIPFGKTLNLIVKSHLKEARYIEQNREEILFHWRSMVKGNST